MDEQQNGNTLSVSCQGATTVNLDEVNDLQGNLKDLTEENYVKLRNSLTEYGFSFPLFFWQDEQGAKWIIDAHQRKRTLLKMREEGWTIPPLPADPIFAANKTEAKKKLLLLNSRYGQMTQEGFDEFTADIPMEDIADLLYIPDVMYETSDDNNIKEDIAPPLSDGPALSELGKIYQLGRHRLMCGDSTKIEDVEKLMNGQKADMVFTDPPYGMFLDADFSDMKNNLDFAKDKGFVGGRKYNNVIGDHQDFNPDFINTIFAVFPEAKEVFMWGANYYSELLQNRNDGSWFVWDKRLDESADKMYGSCFELVWSKNKHKQDIVRIKWAGVFGTEQEFDHKRHHPTQKPVALSAWFIEKFCQPEQKIIDLFGGSGSTLIACEQTNRTCYMMELDPKYVDVIRKRYAKFVGQEESWQEATPEITQA